MQFKSKIQMFGPKKNVSKIVKETLVSIHFTFLKTRCFVLFFRDLHPADLCTRTLDGVRMLAKDFCSCLLGSEGPDTEHSGMLAHSSLPLSGKLVEEETLGESRLSHEQAG